MLQVVCPSHHLFYGYLHRRRLWLEQMSLAYSNEQEPGSRKDFLNQKKAVDDRFKLLRKRLSLAADLRLPYPGIPNTFQVRRSSLARVLDDTPPDSFLYTLSVELGEYEKQLLALFTVRGSFPTLLAVSRAWGQEVAQECLLSEIFSEAWGPTENLNHTAGLLEVLTTVLMGGEFEWMPFLLRRHTGDEVEYEPRYCGHSRGEHRMNDSAHDLLCQLEGHLYEGFIKALVPKAKFRRTAHRSHCVDAISLK